MPKRKQPRQTVAQPESLPKDDLENISPSKHDDDITNLNGDGSGAKKEKVDSIDGQTGQMTVEETHRELQTESPGSKTVSGYQPCLDNLVKELGQKSKMIHMTWAGVLSENENYEVFVVKRIQKLIDEAKAIENKLLQQKEQARKRLFAVSAALTSAGSGF